MQMNEIKRDSPNRSSRQVGRGGKRGKTSGRGGKGQTARAGNKRRPAMRDIIKKLPKLRGRGINVNKAFRQNFIPVNLVDLNILEDGALVTPQSLVAAGLVDMRFGRIPRVKILGTGKLEKKLKFEGVEFSASAKEAVESVK
ncbi:MAG: large subunit ribosomal protein [Patescibacteria group bacterium]|nr:large subunit ribosomal protein [Patescibacteria group bacterium]